MNTNLFVYGTLLFPEIVFAITGKNFKTKPAVLFDYKRLQVFNEGSRLPYPAITKSIGDSVNGMILFDVDAKSMQSIISFEADEYDQQLITFQLDNTYLHAVTFVFKDDLKHRLKSDWDLEEFRKNHLGTYIQKFVRDPYV